MRIILVEDGPTFPRGDPRYFCYLCGTGEQATVTGDFATDGARWKLALVVFKMAKELALVIAARKAVASLVEERRAEREQRS